jgi:hypothetical protein
MAESATYRRGVALFDYTAIESDEISFRRGATIVIFGSPEEGLVNGRPPCGSDYGFDSFCFDRWFEGELDGRVGMW